MPWVVGAVQGVPRSADGLVRVVFCTDPARLEQKTRADEDVRAPS